MKKIHYNLLLALIVILSLSELRSQNNNFQKHIEWDTISYPKKDFGWKEKMTVPNLRLIDVENNEFELYDLLGKVTIIDFWFIACKPCIRNKRYLKIFYRQYDINILSISIDDRSSTVKKYAKENGLIWYNIQDNNSFKNRFKTQIGYGNSFPDYFLITPDKKIKNVYTSGRDIGKLGAELQIYFEKIKKQGINK